MSGTLRALCDLLFKAQIPCSFPRREFILNRRSQSSRRETTQSAACEWVAGGTFRIRSWEFLCCTCGYFADHAASPVTPWPMKPDTGAGRLGLPLSRPRLRQIPPHDGFTGDGQGVPRGQSLDDRIERVGDRVDAPRDTAIRFAAADVTTGRVYSRTIPRRECRWRPGGARSSLRWRTALPADRQQLGRFFADVSSAAGVRAEEGTINLPGCV